MLVRPPPAPLWLILTLKSKRKGLLKTRYPPLSKIRRHRPLSYRLIELVQRRSNLLSGRIWLRFTPYWSHRVIPSETCQPNHATSVTIQKITHYPFTVVSSSETYDCGHSTQMLMLSHLQLGQNKFEEALLHPPSRYSIFGRRGGQ